MQNSPPEPRGVSTWRWVGPLFFLMWTALAGFAFGWLMTASGAVNGEGELLVQGGVNSPHAPLSERIHDWLRLAHLNFFWCYGWFLLAPYVVWLAWRFRFERGRLRWSVPVHLAGAALFAFASSEVTSHLGVSETKVFIFSHPIERQTAVRVLVSTNGVVATEEIASANDLISNLVPRLKEAMVPPLAGIRAPRPRPLSALSDLLAYGVLLGMTHAVHFQRRYRERERRALFLESSLARARLHALQAQLHPHFLFNTLNGIATLLRRDPIVAEEMLTSLSDLLRLALSQSDKQQIPLREEMQLLDRYLEIQQMRFGDRLRCEQDIDPALLDNPVPALLLQPLVENAIKHGLEPSSQPGLVRIVAVVKGDRLVLSVEDNGVGLGKGRQTRATSGVGLSNLRARLEALYGERYHVALCELPEGGVAARIEIPLDPAVLNAMKLPVMS
ncbi:MAG: signal transduction histidine kinase, LytS [Pedosphaera sp.]|nr:signal transduction histidine kinase, LytS [Pedosphaera sp.]